MLPRPPPSTLFPYTRSSDLPSLQAQQDAGAAAAWFPALTTMAGLQANWDFLGDFQQRGTLDRKSTRLNSSHTVISYAVFCLKKKKPHTIGLHYLSKVDDDSY